MKQLLLFGLVCLFAVSCTVDQVLPDLEPLTIEDDQGYLTITVTETNFERVRGGSCNYDNGASFAGVEGARLTLEYEEEERPLPQNVDLVGFTDYTGRYLFEGLPSGDYSLFVSSRLGTRSYDLRVDLGKVTRLRVLY
jgi:hypothetical protein